MEKNDLYRKEFGKIKKSMVNLKQVISDISKQQADLENKVKIFDYAQ